MFAIALLRTSQVDSHPSKTLGGLAALRAICFTQTRKDAKTWVDIGLLVTYPSRLLNRGQATSGNDSNSLFDDYRDTIL